MFRGGRCREKECQLHLLTTYSVKSVIMKKVLLGVLGIIAVFSLMAQPNRVRERDGARLNWAGHADAKTGYQYRMTGYASDDDYEFSTFSYDGRGRLVMIHDSIPSFSSVTDSLFYDENDNMVRLSGWQWLNNEWKNVYYIDYTYDGAGNIVTRTNYNSFGSSEWHLGGVYTYTYNSDNQIVRTDLVFGGMDYQRVEYFYTDGLLMTELWYNYSMDYDSLINDMKVTYEYENGRVTQRHDSIIETGNVFYYSGRDEYTYDEYGNCEVFTHYDGSGDVSERSRYTYNYDMPLSEVQVPWTPEIDRPRTYTNVHAYDREAWYALDQDYVLRYVCDFVYEYETATNGIDNVGATTLTASPNPAKDCFAINGLEEGPARVSVFDAVGRLVMQGTMAAGSNMLNVSRLSAGCYVVKVVQQGKAQSLKLMVE